jgi:hypothetical protein
MNKPDTKTHNHKPQLAPTIEEHTRHTDIQPPNWTDKAKCKGATHLMFPRQHKDITYIPIARLICNNCPVQQHCLNYALSYPTGDLHGVWAGQTPRQLANLQQQHNIRPRHQTLAQMWQDLQ